MRSRTKRRGNFSPREQENIVIHSFTRKIENRDKEGLIFEDIKGHKITGFLRDFELQKLINGKKLLRAVEDLDGDHGFETRTPRPPEEPIGRRLFRIETAGELRDTSLPKYPFSIRDEIQISMKGDTFREGDIVTVKLKFIRREE